jgi:hypothetical protein
VRLQARIAAGLAFAALACASAGAQQRVSGFPDALDVQLSRKNPLPFMAVPAPDEGSVRVAIMERAENLFMSGKFEELEKMAESFRTKDTKTAAGVWKIDLLYQPFTSCECHSDHEKSDDHASMLGMARKYAEKHPSSPTPLIIQAEILYAAAWEARGSGWAKDVRPEQWKLFGERLDQAEQLLADNLEIISRDPAAPALLTKIMSMSSIENGDFLDWLNSAADITPDYAPLYFNAMHLYYPNWRANPGAIEAIANGAVQKSQSSEGRALYARIYLHAWLHYGNELYTVAKVDRAYLREAVFDLLTRYPDRYNFEMFGMMACSLEDWKTAAPIFHRLQELAPREYEWSGDITYQGCRSRMYQINGNW